nr:MAG TPA_asm: GLUCOSE-6-PHOSPHATE 1-DEHYDROGENASE [Caudoviricetes sp.]
MRPRKRHGLSEGTLNQKWFGVPFIFFAAEKPRKQTTHEQREL